MNIENFKNIFRSHVEQYDMNDTAILRKLYHSYRVMDFCVLLAKYNNFSDENTEISILVGLLHDYARFDQWTKYKTYSDIKSIDHGDLAVEKLFDNNEIKNYCLNKEYYDEIYDAIKYHNKISIPDDISEHNKLICKVIRDADKLDILYLYGEMPNLVEKDMEKISKKIEKEFYSNKLINRKEVKNKNDNFILHLAMIYDLNFKYSFEYIKNYNLLDKIYKNIEDKDRFKPYFDHMKNYVEERIR